MTIASSLPRLGVLLAAASFLMPTLNAQTLVHDRTGAVNASRAVVAGTVVARARQATDLGVAAANTPVAAMTLRFNLTDQQSVALTALASAQQNPQSASYRQWLTPEQYGSQFGLSTDDLAKVTGWLETQGFSSITVARSRSFVTFSGTAGQVAEAFGTTLHQVKADGETHLANLTDPALPAGFAGVVSTVTGLNDFRLRAHVRSREEQASSTKYTSSISGSTFIAPGDFYTIYNTLPLLNQSINGTGLTIAVMGQTDIYPADDAAFRAASGLPANAPTIKLYGTDPGFPSMDDLEEASLDVEWSGAVAPSAAILFVNSTNVISGSLTQTIDNNLAPIITISYGDCEAGYGSANLATFNQLFRQANVQGQTILGPSGDSGATDCDYQTKVATQGLAVDFPASSPYVTGVGGTMFNENGGVYFAATNGLYQGSALSYIPEAVWNESLAGTGIEGGGGGVSAYFTKPAFQVGTGVPADFSRDVPDVSFNADPDHDGYLFCYNGSCTNGFRNASNGLQVVGGTSISTPSFAGIMALLEQKIQARVGNANPVIYGLANSTYYSTVFHDVTVGGNTSPCTAGTPSCPNGGAIGYSAGTGYDLASGWGSVNALNMVNDWLLVTPSGITSTIGANAAAVSVVPSATSVLAGATVTAQVTVTSATSGVTTTPTGSVQLLLNNVPSGSSVMLVNGVATLTVPTTGLNSGANTISAAYSGDALYAGVKGAFTLDIVSASAADFTLTPSSATATAKSGTTATGITFTVTPVNGFVGAVTFTAAANVSTLNATGNFTVNPVTITTTAAGSTVFQLSAYESLATPGTAQHRLTTSAVLRGTSPWMLTGTGAAMAGLFLLVLPKRRKRWSALVVGLLSLGLFAASGCSGPQGSNQLNAATGTYTITVTASGTNAAGTAVSHSSVVTFVVQ